MQTVFPDTNLAMPATFTGGSPLNQADIEETNIEVRIPGSGIWVNLDTIPSPGTGVTFNLGTTYAQTDAGTYNLRATVKMLATAGGKISAVTPVFDVIGTVDDEPNPPVFS